MVSHISEGNVFDLVWKADIAAQTSALARCAILFIATVWHIAVGTAFTRFNNKCDSTLERMHNSESLKKLRLSGFVMHVVGDCLTFLENDFIYEHLRPHACQWMAVLLMSAPRVYECGVPRSAASGAVATGVRPGEKSGYSAAVETPTAHGFAPGERSL
ncbi:hypothetical protein EVAR_50983_1 [Eumeta japonica]|uniref:Uncharacterized protein n=1 Tax=Eumeta variegata TaxID=151549 RepID=A0A4C1XE70_EUMVA|nr:hypothetical protein EVAR_50983_1 [Eumeta japonica]